MSSPIHRVEVYAGPNRGGEYHYAIFWMADYHPGHPEGEYRIAERGQHYLASLDSIPKDIKWEDKRNQ